MSSQRVLGGWALAFVLLVGGCTGGNDASTTPTAVSPPTTAAGGATATSASGPTVTAAGPTTTAGAIAVVLAPDRLVVGGNALVYGAPRRQVRAYLDRALGAPTDTDEQDCGPGRLESFAWPGIIAYVDASGFVGWTADGESFATPQNVRIGSSRLDVEVAYPRAEVTESSLGTEFFVPGAEEGTGLSGIYEGGEVTALWSGTTCVAR